MHSGNFNRYFSVYSNRCTQRTEDDRTVRKVLYAYDRDSSLIRVELPEDITTARTWLTRNVNADFSRTPGVSKPSPALGNGNREILGGIGMTEEEIGRLQSKWLEAKR